MKQWRVSDLIPRLFENSDFKDSDSRYKFPDILNRFMEHAYAIARSSLGVAFNAWQNGWTVFRFFEKSQLSRNWVWVFLWKNLIFFIFIKLPKNDPKMSRNNQNWQNPTRKKLPKLAKNHQKWPKTTKIISMIQNDLKIKIHALSKNLVKKFCLKIFIFMRKKFEINNFEFVINYIS